MNVPRPDTPRAFLEALAAAPPRPYGEGKLDAVMALLGRLGDPQRGLPVIHITGSKGKGSTALLVESILHAAGLRTGVFTSPHLQRWTERLRLDGRELDDGLFDTLLARLRPEVEALDRAGHRPGFFDVLTAAALLLFRERGVDYAVMEAGLGGRLDATNVVEPVVCCITGVELEHTAQLGGTVAAIAREKAGIVKPGVPVVTGRLPRPAAREIARRARAVNAPWWRLGREFGVSVARQSEAGQTLRLELGGRTMEVFLPLPGRHQADNAALAAACVRRLERLAPGPLGAALGSGLAAARLPGRAEILRRRPWVVVDGAHTAASIRALAAVLATLPARPAHLVLSFSAGRDPGFCAPLLSRSDRVTVTRADPCRSLDPAAAARRLRALAPGLAVAVAADPVAALAGALDGLPEDGLLCATGSVYLAGRAREVLG